MIGRFFSRTGLTKLVGDQGNPLTNIQVFKGIVSYWIAYFPIGKPYFSKIVIEGISEYGINLKLLVPFFVLVLGFIFTLYYLAWKSQDQKRMVYIYGLLFLIPISYIFLLKQFSYVHNFSAFPIGLPIVFSIMIVPVLLVTKIPQNFSIFFVVIIGFIILTSRTQFMKFKDVRVGSNINQDLGVLVAQNIKFDDLPITNPRPLSVVPLLQNSLVVQPLPPQALWHTNRYIYDVSQLKQLIEQGKLNLVHVKNMNPVFLAYKEEKIDNDVSSICQGKWIELEQKVDNRRVVACKTNELSRLYL
jgi:hypothetical protein